MAPCQAFTTSYAPRLRQYGNAFVIPIIQPTTNVTSSRTTKRGTIAINYAEDGYDDDDFDDSEGPRRPTGLRSLRRDDSNLNKESAVEKLGRQVRAPVDVQGIFRDWMVRRNVKPSTDQQVNIQAQLPLTLIPIRIDLEIPAHQPPEPFPLPRNHMENGINPSLPAYRRPEPVPPYRVKDTFLWNLHESLMTPDDFAAMLVRDLDLPNAQALTMSISQQIRTQLEEYAGVALHPLFHSTQAKPTNGLATASQTVRNASSRDQSLTPGPNGPATPTPITDLTKTNGSAVPSITATATPIPSDQDSSYLNPDDTYRCILTLNINLLSTLYTDKFEWSLLHGPGLAEAFSKQTCADLGLNGEWVAAMTHAIYEAVLRLKKEACESGGLLMAGATGYSEIDNQAANGAEGGWRFDNEGLGDEWEPKVEALSKEEIEKREENRERQIRRLRRETARFSSTAGMTMPPQQQQQNSYFENPEASSETPMGRGERSKKKRRFRSLSPLARGRTPGTPGGETGIGAGYGGGGGGLSDWERQTFRCSHCMVWGSAVWAVRDGPNGPRSLCNNCGLLYERDKRLPVWSKDLHRHDLPVGR